MGQCKQHLICGCHTFKQCVFRHAVQMLNVCFVKLSSAVNKVIVEYFKMYYRRSRDIEGPLMRCKCVAVQILANRHRDRV